MLNAARYMSASSNPAPHDAKRRKLPRDLADCSVPIALEPLQGEALAALALSSAQVDKFDRDGFVATEQPVLTPAQLEQLRADLDALVSQQPPHPKVDLLHELHYNEAAGSDSVLFHCLGHWRCTPGFHDLAFLDAICLPASQLLHGRAVRFWHDQAFVKPGGNGAVVQWHQDYSCAWLGGSIRSLSVGSAVSSLMPPCSPRADREVSYRVSTRLRRLDAHAADGAPHSARCTR